MCFVLYVASRSSPELIPWDEERPQFSTQTPSEHDAQALKRQFTLPVVTYLGSDQGCGCGFRHFPQEIDVQFEVPPNYFTDEVDDGDTTQPNHSALAEHLKNQFATEPFVELFRCWSGDEDQPQRVTKEIYISKITEATFGFHERALYKMNL